MTTISRRMLLAGAALSIALPARAQTWPQRPVMIVVPQPAGNSPDILCRVIAENSRAPWGSNSSSTIGRGGKSRRHAGGRAGGARRPYVFVRDLCGAGHQSLYVQEPALRPDEGSGPGCHDGAQQSCSAGPSGREGDKFAGVDRARAEGAGHVQPGRRRPSQSDGSSRPSHQQIWTGRIHPGPLQQDRPGHSGHCDRTHPGHASIRIGGRAFHQGRLASADRGRGKPAHRLAARCAEHLRDAQKRGPPRLVHDDGASRHAAGHRPEAEARKSTACCRSWTCRSAHAYSASRSTRATP